MTAADWSILYSTALERTATDLRRAGYRGYAPYYRRLVSRGERRPLTELCPVFGSLLFVQDWHGFPATVTIGAHRGLMRDHAGKILAIADSDIWKIMCRERSGDYDEVKWAPGGKMSVRDDIAVGDQVSVDEFGRRIVGVLRELSPNGRAVIEAILFGREVPLNVDAAALERVEGVNAV